MTENQILDLLKSEEKKYYGYYLKNGMYENFCISHGFMLAQELIREEMEREKQNKCSGD